LTDAWLPGASQVRAAADGGPLQGGAPRVVWQSLGADPQFVTARSAAQRLILLGRACHLVWNPLAGEIVQLIPIVRAACSLGSPESLQQAGPPGPEESGTLPGPAAAAPAEPAAMYSANFNAEGRLCVQIGVVAFAQAPFTSGPLSGLEAIMDWLDSWGISRSWPAGTPAPFPQSLAAPRSRRLWARGGHFGASQVPHSPAVGPGAVNIERLTGPGAYPAIPSGRGPAEPNGSSADWASESAMSNAG